tara:strand:+ start:1822 stop:2847 length:1026 start_codon:yes stop_codon:yes gene_type:complete
MFKYFFPLIFIFVACSSEDSKVTTNLDDFSEKSTPTPITKELEPTVAKENKGEIKYNHPKIIDTDEIKELTFKEKLKEIEDVDSKSFMIFLEISKFIDLEKNLKDYENFTLLVPDDEAFAGIEPDLKIKILSDKELALKIISNHILPFKFKENNLKKYSHLDTINDGSIDVQVSDRKLIINEKVNIIDKDLEIKNGYIHLINNVILPKDLNINNDQPLINFNDIIGNIFYVIEMHTDQKYFYDREHTLEISFDMEGKFSGKYLCNNIFGNYKINDFGRILIDDPASTKMFCFPPNENVEMNTDIILDFLTSNDLDLKSADGTPENIFFESENKKLYLKLID